MGLNLTELEAEQSRIYHYKDGAQFIVNDVTHFADSTTTHRLRTKDGHLWIVMKENVVAIELVAANFTL